MKTLLATCNLKNAITSRSIDHILYSTETAVEVASSEIDWGPKSEDETRGRTRAHLSDHPWVWCELQIRARTDPK